MSVDKAALDSLVKRAMSFADTYTYQVKFTLNGNLQAESSNPDKGSFKEAIPCEVEAKAGKGAGIVMGFNGKYLRNILKALPGPRVQAEFNAPLCASIWTQPGNDKHTCLLMPIRLPE
jgi:DNA polymerase III sliding clamp (beta) subunit (PCNA family)